MPRSKGRRQSKGSSQPCSESSTDSKENEDETTVKSKIRLKSKNKIVTGFLSKKLKQTKIASDLDTEPQQGPRHKILTPKFTPVYKKCNTQTDVEYEGDSENTSVEQIDFYKFIEDEKMITSPMRQKNINPVVRLKKIDMFSSGDESIFKVPLVQDTSKNKSVSLNKNNKTVSFTEDVEMPSDDTSKRRGSKRKSSSVMEKSDFMSLHSASPRLNTGLGRGIKDTSTPIDNSERYKPYSSLSSDLSPVFDKKKDFPSSNSSGLRTSGYSSIAALSHEGSTPHSPVPKLNLSGSGYLSNSSASGYGVIFDSNPRKAKRCKMTDSDIEKWSELAKLKCAELKDIEDNYELIVE